MPFRFMRYLLLPQSDTMPRKVVTFLLISSFKCFTFICFAQSNAGSNANSAAHQRYHRCVDAVASLRRTRSHTKHWLLCSRAGMWSFWKFTLCGFCYWACELLLRFKIFTLFRIVVLFFTSVFSGNLEDKTGIKTSSLSFRSSWDDVHPNRTIFDSCLQILYHLFFL